MDTGRRSKVDVALLDWYKEKQLKGAHVTDGELRDKARELNVCSGGDQKFAASVAWLNRWKKNYFVSSASSDKSFSQSTSSSSKNYNVDKILNMFSDEIPNERCKKNPPILFIEPFYGGSHKQLIDTLTNEFEDRCEIVTLPAKKWPWRARYGALLLSELIPMKLSYRTLFCSSVLNLAELLALRPDLLKLKKIVYFHENQLTYPKKETKKRDFQFGYNQITTCIVSDIVIFNSMYNLKSFLWNIEGFLNIMPDCRPRDVVKKIEKKLRVIYFPIHFSRIPKQKSLRCYKILHIVWPHRWEFDKGPEEFFGVLFRLKEKDLPFQVSVLGETFTDVPDIFKQAKEKLQDEILHWGYVKSKNDYYDVLHTAHVVVSTAIHEFFGVAMLEAVHCGCFPLVPNRLVYPEIYEKQCLYKDENDFYDRLAFYSAHPYSIQKDYNSLTLDFKNYSYENLLPEYKTLF